MKSTFAIFRVRRGWMGLVGNQKGLQRIYLPGLKKNELKKQIKLEFPESREEPSSWREIKEQFKEYFLGKRVKFQVPLDLSPATPFQRKVYKIMTRIPYGEVRTYQWLAERVGNPQALRAVGLANRKNRWPLVVPCHRVVAKNGHLTGFSAPGGLALKTLLLNLEGVSVSDNRVSLKNKN